MNKNVNIDEDKAMTLFYEFKELGNEVGRLGAIVQNPKFAKKEDVEIFEKDCELVEKKYSELVSKTLKLFEE